MKNMQNTVYLFNELVNTFRKDFRLFCVFTAGTLFFLLTGCQPAEAKITPTFQTTAINQFPSATSTAVESDPIGSEKNPLVIAYIYPLDQPVMIDETQPVVDALTDELPYEIEFRLYKDPQLAFDELRKGKIHFFFVHPLTYLAATDRNLLDAQLAANHFGLYSYGSQFFVNKDSGFTPYFDPKTNQSNASAQVALRQFEGKKPCWTDDKSISGTILPTGLLKQNGISFRSASYLQNPIAVIRALYIKGICDFGVTYAHSGDPRTSSQVINDLPDVLEQIIVVWQSDPVIPTLTLASIPTVPELIVEDIDRFFYNFAQTEEGKRLLSRALQYDIQGFLRIEDDYFNQLRELIKAADINPYRFLGY